MDFMVVYNVVLLNDGQPQFYFDHPAYFTILLVKGWFRLLHQFGLLDAWKLSAIPSSGAAAFDEAMTSTVRAGRLLSFLIAVVVLLTFAGLMRRIVHDRCILGLENKVHAILPIAALPLMILPFGSAAGTSTIFWKQDPRRWLAVTAFPVIAVLILWRVGP
jgi:hypothetical protein